MKKINLQPALVSMDHDEDILYAVIGAFIQEVPALIAQLLEALQNRDRHPRNGSPHSQRNFRILPSESANLLGQIVSLAHEGDFDQITSLLPEAKGSQKKCCRNCGPNWIRTNPDAVLQPTG